MNTLLKKYSQQYFIQVKQTHTYPRFSSVSKIDFDGNDYFGPYNNRDTVKKLIDIVSKTFLIRECLDKEFKRGKKCYLYDIKRCLAPCIYECKNEYEKELSIAYNFLEGENQNVINKLLSKMQKLSQEKKYEEAAEIRDITNQVLNQLNKSSILAEPINKANALIKIRSANNYDYILFIDGKMLIKDFNSEGDKLFDMFMADYYSNQIETSESPTKQDLSRMKIALSWLVNNRNSYEIYYLNKYNSYDKIINEVGL